MRLHRARNLDLEPCVGSLLTLGVAEVTNPTSVLNLAHFHQCLLPHVKGGVRVFPPQLCTASLQHLGEAFFLPDGCTLRGRDTQTQITRARRQV